jgi:hypothetical protein
LFLLNVATTFLYNSDFFNIKNHLLKIISNFAKQKKSIMKKIQMVDLKGQYEKIKEKVNA